MSFQAMTWAGSEPTLKFTTSVSGVRTIDKMVLALLECAALGISDAQSLRDIERQAACSNRTFRDAMKRLERDGWITFKSKYPATIAFGPYEVTLDQAGKPGGDIRWQIIKAKVFAEKGAVCVYCGGDAWQIDHVLPRSRGGTDDIDNLVPACGDCNWSKGAKTPEEWRQ